MVSFVSVWGSKVLLKCTEKDCGFTFHKDNEEGMKDHALFHQMGPEQYKMYKGR